MGEIISIKEKLIICIFTVSLAALLFYFQLEPSGVMTAKAQEKAQQAESPQKSETSAIVFSSYGLEQCRDELAVYMKSMDDLRDIVLNKCEKPYHDFEAAAWEIAKSHKYSEDEFNCNDFSNLLVQNLGKLGYESRVVHGYYKGEPHAWVVMEVPIEATSGNLITPQYYSDYKSGQ